MKHAANMHKSAPHVTQDATPTTSIPSKGVALMPPTAAINRRPLQLMAGAGGDATSVQPENRTGLPDKLKAGVERLSGLPMDDVRVHYNSAKPAQLQALAYTQGTEIHVAPGQERYLPHEAWHVVQQKQGRVQPTIRQKGLAINDSTSLENEADVMGEQAVSRGQFSPVQRTETQQKQSIVRTIQLGKRKRKSQGNQSNKKRKTSGFGDTASDKSGFIYGIWKNESFPNKVKETKLTHDDKCLYVGKVDREPIDRFDEHVRNDSNKPWWIGNGHDYSGDPDKWPYVTRTLWKYNGITKFDVAAAEQYYMQFMRARGGASCNDRNELTKNKFDDHKDDDDIFTTKNLYPPTWKPVNIFSM